MTKGVLLDVENFTGVLTGEWLLSRLFTTIVSEATLVFDGLCERESFTGSDILTFGIGAAPSRSAGNGDRRGGIFGGLSGFDVSLLSADLDEEVVLLDCDEVLSGEGCCFLSELLSDLRRGFVCEPDGVRICSSLALFSECAWSLDSNGLLSCFGSEVGALRSIYLRGGDWGRGGRPCLICSRYFWDWVAFGGWASLSVSLAGNELCDGLSPCPLVVVANLAFVSA